MLIGRLPYNLDGSNCWWMTDLIEGDQIVFLQTSVEGPFNWWEASKRRPAPVPLDMLHIEDKRLLLNELHACELLNPALFPEYAIGGPE